MGEREKKSGATMTDYDYGQKEPMENEAMVLTLETQARAIWPQEKPILERLLSGQGLDVIDIGCGTGEISSRTGDASTRPAR